ncbi:hypothetical protein [Sphingobium sp. CCH11-B1]|jgi:hypothetical protein|uniref:hypothetical protein n=1 Tax=Sphingobium sp. CCH11-B1 TaxID=1768781 RepID=UPI000B10124E|nr:hypothetical protein [Sphingobium sp. CCH11-B1]
MGDIAFGVDEVAAHNLLIALGLEASEDRIAEVAAHMRAHRASAEQYRLDKARDDLFAHLENAFLRFRAHDDHWNAGYAAAESEALNWFAERPPVDAPPPARTTGEILRAMIREQKSGPRDGRH